MFSLKLLNSYKNETWDIPLTYYHHHYNFHTFNSNDLLSDKPSYAKYLHQNSPVLLLFFCFFSVIVTDILFFISCVAESMQSITAALEGDTVKITPTKPGTGEKKEICLTPGCVRSGTYSSRPTIVRNSRCLRYSAQSNSNIKKTYFSVIFRNNTYVRGRRVSQ